jgi:hypothetical protein
VQGAPPRAAPVIPPWLAGPAPPSTARRYARRWPVAGAGLAAVVIFCGVAWAALNREPPAERREKTPEPSAAAPESGLTTTAVVPAHAPAIARPAVAPAPKVAVPDVPVAAVKPLLKDEPPKCDASNYGTSVPFLNSPLEAAREAQRTGKLVLLLHISGNFEDKQFT